MLSDELDSKPEVSGSSHPSRALGGFVVTHNLDCSVALLSLSRSLFSPLSCWCSLCRTRPSRWCRVWRTRGANTPACLCWVQLRARCASRWSSQVSSFSLLPSISGRNTRSTTRLTFSCTKCSVVFVISTR